MPITVKSIILVILAALPLRLSASPQLPDYIIFKKDTISTYNLILEQYLRSLDSVATARLFGLNFRDGASLNCWRGYQAIYMIENDSLFLVDIIRCHERSNNSIDKAASAEKMKAIFGNHVANGRVHIDWFSGDINFPLTNKVLRWDGVFYKIYEKEKVIAIISGQVTRIEDVENYVDDPKAIDRKDKKKISGILFKKFKKVKWKSADDCDCSEKYLVTIDEAGKVSKVAMARYETEEEIDERWDRDEYNFCMSTVFNALRPLRFDIIKDKGKPIAENVLIEIWITENGKIENWTN